MFDEWIETGSDKAYSNGEKPISYWHKKTILSYVFHYLDEYKKTGEGARKYAKLMKETNLTDEQIKEQIKKANLHDLQTYILQKTETHLTGSYIMNKLRHTKFFKVVKDNILLSRLRGYILRPVIVKQLTIRGIENDKTSSN